MKSGSKPPVGVKVISIIVLFYSLIFAISAVSAFSRFISLSLLFAFFAIIAAILGAGLWNGKAIPRVITVLLSGICLISIFFGFIRNLSDIKLILTAPAPLHVVIPVLILTLFIILPLIILIYLLFSKKAKSYYN